MCSQVQIIIRFAQVGQRIGEHRRYDLREYFRLPKGSRTTGVVFELLLKLLLLVAVLLLTVAVLVVAAVYSCSSSSRCSGLTSTVETPKATTSVAYE